MSKNNLQISLSFNADTSAALKNLQNLRTSLNEIAAMPLTIGKGSINADLQKAVTSAKQLQQHLGAAMDVKTGNLNLSKLEASLKSSNASLSTLTSNLLHAGSAGEQAFLSTYSAIAQANMQLKQANGLAAQFMVTLKNTLKWQLSSSLIHGVISGFQSAIGYAKELDTSLNNIRIVTNYSAEHMADFAKKANDAAKALKTTTTAYTNASLIYYQQGLNDEEVDARTRTTVKLANVTGESAETVSEWMTAIWNNFDDGGKSMEYYADVITALGAATASSAKEISAGLEKFAAVADTVGLSYENATAALATITAETRQSADVVGTALKTLFARIQDLKLGNTLEDGTDLGKYSAELKKAGVNIKEANGELKEMDVILKELGTKWELLDRGQQVALAKSVAGIRQYTQLIALMDNFDIYEQNQAIAATAEGTLERQQKTFEESWKAATASLKASTEDLYSSLIPKDFIIDFVNGLSKVVSGITNVVEAFGGMKTIILLLATMVLSKFQTSIATAIDSGVTKIQNFAASTKDLIASLKALKKEDIASKITTKIKEGPKSTVQKTTEGLDKRNKLQQEYTDGLKKATNMKTEDGKAIALSKEFQTQVTTLQKIDEQNVRLTNLQNKMTAGEKEELSLQLQQVKALGDQQAALEKKSAELDLQKEKLLDQESLAFSISERGFKKSGDSIYKQTDYALTEGQMEGFERAAKSSVGRKLNDGDYIGDSSQSMSFNNPAEAKEAAQASLNIVRDTAQAYQEINMLQQTGVNIQKDELNQWVEKTGLLTQEQKSYLQNIKSLDELQEKLGMLSQGAQEYSRWMGNGSKSVAEMANIGRQHATVQNDINAIVAQQNNIFDNIKKNIQQIVERGRSIGTIFATGLKGAGQFAMGINMIVSAFDSLNNAMENNSVTFSVILGTISSLSMAIPMIINGFNTFGEIINKENILLLANNILKWENARQADKNTKETMEEAEAHDQNGDQIRQENTELIKNKVLKLTDKGGTGGKGGKAPFDAKVHQGGGKTSGGGKNPDLKVVDGAKKGGGDSINTMGQAFKRIAIYVAPVVVAVAIMTAGVVLMTKYFNKAEEAAKKARESADQMKKSYEDVLEQSKTLNDNISKYSEAQGKLDGLVRGTYEYNKALMESNEAAMELIKSNKSLANSYEIVNGEIVINKDAMEEAQQQQLINQQAALAQSNMADLNARQAEQAAKQEKALKKADIEGSRVDEGAAIGVGGAAVGTAAGIGLAVGLANGWNPVGWVILALGGVAAVGSLIAGAVEGNSTATEEAVVNHLTEAYEENPNMFASKETLAEVLGPKFEHLADELWENRETLEDLVKSNNELKLQEQLLTKQMAQVINKKIFSDEDAIDDNRQQDAVDQSTANIMSTDEYKDAKKDLKNEIKGQDGLVTDLYNYFYESEGKTVKTGSGDKATINYQDGTSEKTTQNAIADAVVVKIQEAVATGDKEAIMTIVRAAKGVSGGNEDQIEEILGKLDIEDEVKAELEKIQAQSGTLDKISSLSGSTNAVAHSQTLTAIQAGKENEWDADFSFLTREQMNDLLNNRNKFDSEAQKIIAAGASNYEADRVKANIKEMEDFDSDDYEQKDRQSIITKAGISDTEFEAYASSIVSAQGLVGEGAEEMAKEIAEANLRVKSGLTDVQETFKEYGKYLTPAHQGTLEYSQGVAKLTKNLNDWFGVEFDTTTIENNLGDIEAALNGDVQAIERLQYLAAKEIILDIDLPGQQEMEVLNLINELSQEQIEINAVITTTQAGMDLMQYYENLMTTGQMTTEQVQKSLEALGYEVEQKTKEVADQTIKVFGHEFKFGKKTINTIDWDNTRYKGKFSDQAIDFKPKDSETSTEKNRRLQDLDGEADRYRELKQLTSYISKELDRISMKKDKAFGKNKIKAIEEEIAAYDAEIAVQDELIKKSEEYLAADQKTVESFGGKIDPNTGVVTNYDEVEQAYLNQLKGMSPDDSNYQEVYDQYQAFKDAVSQYENTYDQYQSAITTKTEKELAKIEAILEGVDYTVQINIEANGRQLAYLERIFKRLDNDMYDGAKRIANYTEQIGAEFKDIEDSTKGIRKTLEAEGVSAADIEHVINTGDASVLEKYDNLSETAITNVKNYVDEISSSQENIEEYQKFIQEEVMNTFNAWNDKLSETSSLLNSYGDILNNYQNIVDIVGPGYLGIGTDMLKKMNKASVDVAMSSFKAAQDQLKFQTESRKELQKDLDDVLKGVSKEDALKFQQTGDIDVLKNYKIDEEEAERLQEQIETIDTMIVESQSNVAASWGDTLNTIYETFGDNVQNILNDFEKRMSGMKFDSFDSLTDSMDKQKEITDLYVEDYEKIYELSKLDRQLQQKINETDSAKGKAILLEMEEEINTYQQNGVKMSQYELENLQKKYDLKLAEIALEEAQNAKSQVMLTRDSEGNFSYTYTADEEGVNEAEQGYEDKLFAMQEHNNQYIDDLQNKMIELSKRMQEEIGALNVSSFETREAYEAEVARITGYYTELQTEYSRELEMALGSNKDLYENDWAKYAESTGYKMSYSDLWVDNFNETNLSILTGYETLEDYESQFVASTALLLGELGEVYETWEGQVKKCMEQAGVDTSTLGQGVKGFVDDVSTLLTGDQETAFKEVMKFAGQQVTGFKDSALGTLNGEKDSLYIGMGKFIENGDELFNGSTKDKTFAKTLTAAHTKVDEMRKGIKGTLSNPTDSVESAISAFVTNADGYLLGETGSLNAALTSTGTKFGSLKTAVSTALSSTSGAGKKVNDFNTVMTTAIFGAGGSSGDVKGGVMKAVNDTILKFGSLSTTAKNKFKATSDKAVTFAADFNPEIESSKDWVDKLESSIATLSKNWADTEIDITVKDTGAKAVVDGVINELNRLKDQTVNINYAVNGSGNGNGGNNNSPINGANVQRAFGGNVEYVKVGEHYYTQGKASDSEWNKVTSGEISDPTKVSGITQHTDAGMNSLQHRFDRLTGDTGIELTSVNEAEEYQIFYTRKAMESGDIDNGGGFMYSGGWDGAVHPNITVTDVGYSSNGKFYAYGKVTGNARGGLTKNQSYWFPIEHLNKKGVTDYYTDDDFAAGVDFAGFDTGGYTGAWGPEGRMAMLHQKEIVLNAHDTENLLSIISMVRDMNDRIEVNARTMQYGLTAAYTANNINPHTDTLQQEVHITAEFPNATNHSEIEEAFRNLNNLASQYANRKF